MALTVRQVQTAKVGAHGDGNGLYLQVATGGSRSWIFRYQLRGKRRELGLGGFPAVSLATARDRTIDARRQLAAGIDPIEQRRGQRQDEALGFAKAMTFKQCADAYIAAHRAGWKPKHAAQWATSLETYVRPVFGAVPAEAVDVGMVLAVLEPLWATKTETANRLRGRIEAVLDWARARGFRRGENPARWRGHLDSLLPRPSKVQQVVHHAALPYAEIGTFMAALREHAGVAARALEFAVLTAARTGEVLGATWDEINIAERVWTVPAGRMKAGREHRVPLSGPAMAIIEQMSELRTGDFVFPGWRAGEPRSGMALLLALRRIRGGLTTHGFRSTFRDWCAEATSFPSEVAEMALAHAVGDKVEAAYRRGDLFDKRRQLAEAWGRYCGQATAVPAEILPLHRRRAS
jgi:integrase